jgi:histidinol-phosphate phosphatase family protein
MTQAIILAGGKGTRLAERLGGLPKPLVDLAGVPLVERQIRHLARFSVTDIALLVGHGAEHIASFIAKLEIPGVAVRLIHDGEPRGTAGAVLSALDELAQRFVVVYGDTLINVDLGAFIAAHARAAADVTLFLHPNDHPQDSDIVEIDDEHWVKRFHPYPHPDGAYLPNLVNAALYVVEKRSLAPYREAQPPLDFGKNLFPRMLEAGAKILGYSSFEYIKDLGTPKRLEKVERDLRNGTFERASIAVRQRAVFVDRDGTLNMHRGLITHEDQLDLLPGVAQGIRRLNETEFRVVVITNQPVIARGEASFDQLRAIHYKLETLLGEEGAFLDAIYFCPHHPDRGFPGEVAALKIECDCRKPNIGLVERAAHDMNIELRCSWMIGDTMRDIQMAERAGLRAALVRSGVDDEAQRFKAKPEFICKNFNEAVDVVLGSAKRAT